MEPGLSSYQFIWHAVIRMKVRVSTLINTQEMLTRLQVDRFQNCKSYLWIIPGDGYLTDVDKYLRHTFGRSQPFGSEIGSLNAGCIDLGLAS